MDKLVVSKIAELHGLPASLVLSVIQAESGGDQYAWRCESRYKYLWDVRQGRPFRTLTTNEMNNEIAPDDFHAIHGSSRNTEWLGQQASWGPMQVMGAVARELGFLAHFPALCGESGVMIGCQKLSELAHKYKPVHGWPGVVAAYNAGSVRFDNNGYFVNSAYVDRVITGMG